MPAVAAADGASIESAQPQDGAVRLLVSVPGEAAVDLTGVTVSLGGTDVATEAAAAAGAEDVERITILAIDTSNSMRGARIKEAKKAAGAFLNAAPANVRVGLVTFDSTVQTLLAPGLDRDAARQALDGLKLTRQTKLYDGVLGALETAGPAVKTVGQRKVLVLSDGKDTSKTSLASVIAAVKKSKAQVDVVSLQQDDAGNQALVDIAEAGNGTVLDATDPTALTTAFADEADALARQIVVTAEVPESVSGNSADVQVTVPVGSESFTAAAYLPVRAASTDAGVPSSSAASDPLPVASAGLAIPVPLMFTGVAALGGGLIAMIVLLGLRTPQATPGGSLAQQIGVYGAGADPGGRARARAKADVSLADQARQAAAKALANNKGLEARIAQRLEGAGMALKPSEWLLMHAGIAVLAGLVGALLGGGSLLLGIIFLAVGAVGPWVYLGLKRTRRLAAFNSSLADTLQLMAGSLSAGLSLAQSIDTIVREGSEPITSEFKRVVIESRLGVTLEDSLEGVASRMESKDFGWVVMAIRIQREVGGNLSELLLTVAATLRERDYLRRHVRALSAEGRLSCYILGGLPPAFLLYLTVSRPEYVKPMYTTPIGWMMCAAMGILLTVGVVWMSKVSKVEI
ncbi:MAG: type II secretion system F family protein [Marmoricola sp.]